MSSTIVFFSLGAIVASFVGVVVARLNTGEGFLASRSRCDACDEVLEPRVLVPIVSFLFSRGWSRCCGVRLSLYSPLAEAILGGLFAFAYMKIGFVSALWWMLLSFSLLLALVLYDLAHQILPTVLLGSFVVSSAVTSFLLAPSTEAFMEFSVTAICLALFLAAIHVLSRGRAMGFADAPFTFALALLVGSAAIPGFAFSFWIGAVIGIALLLQRPRGSRMGIEVPFAPFLAAGFLLAYLTQWNPFIITALLSH